MGTVRIPRRLQRAARRLRPCRGESGQTLVEFSLVLPIFLVLLFALVDFGRGYYSWVLVTNAAREGARAAAVQSDANTIDAKIYGSFCPSWPSTSGCGIEADRVHRTVSNPQGARGTQTTVRVWYDFEFVTPIGGFLSILGGSSLSAPTISSTTSMRLE